MTERRRPNKWPCPKCLERTEVIDSRGEHRRRKCIACGYRFSTREILVRDKFTTTSRHTQP